MAMDMMVNLYYCVLITSVVNKDIGRKYRSLKQAARQSTEAPGEGGSVVGVRSFLASAGLAQFADKLQALGVETVAELGDADLVTDVELADAGLGTIHIKKLRRALVAAPDGTAVKEKESTEKSLAPTPADREEEQEQQGPVANPRVAYLCANLYFAEMTEIMGPLLMGTMSLVIYYLLPDNRPRITFMDPRVGVTEARFLQGMMYVLVDAVLESVTFAGLILYMRKVIGVDPMRVGWYCVTKHKAYYFFIHVTMSICFICCFLRNNGHDTTFQFRWLDSDFTYDPNNATIMADFLWS